jgi:hypothetical protein
VRELRLDGLTFSLGVGIPMPPASYEGMRATTSTIRLTDIGAPVSIRPPPADQIVREPASP